MNSEVTKNSKNVSNLYEKLEFGVEKSNWAGRTSNQSESSEFEKKKSMLNISI